MKKLLFLLFPLLISGWGLNAQSLELMAGDKGLFADIQYLRPLFGDTYRFSVFARTRGNLTYQNKADLLAATYFNYTSKYGVGASVLGSLSSSNGAGGGAGINYFKVHKALTVFALLAVEVDRPPQYSLFSIVRYQPVLKDNWKLYTSLEVYTLMAHTGHAASVQRARVGVDWKKLQFGPAVNLAQLGTKGSYSGNYGFFVRREF